MELRVIKCEAQKRVVLEGIASLVFQCLVNFSMPTFLISPNLWSVIILYKYCYKEIIWSLEIRSTFSLSGWVLSSWRTSNFKVPDSFNQAATTEPVDTYLPILHFATRNGAPMLVRSASIARLKAPSPTTLLCFPHPVRMLHND